MEIKYQTEMEKYMIAIWSRNRKITLDEYINKVAKTNKIKNLYPNLTQKELEEEIALFIDNTELLYLHFEKIGYK